MKQLWKRAAALTLAAAMCLSLASCGKKDAGDGQEETGKNGGQEQTLAQELGYGYLSEYEDLGDMNLSYVSSASALNGTLYLGGDYYDEKTFESGYRLYARELSTGKVTEIPVPELESGEYVNEYIQSLSVCPDGSGYWLAVNRYTFDPGTEGNVIPFGEPDVEAAPVEEAPVAEEPAEEAPLDESGAVGAGAVQAVFLAEETALEESPEEPLEELPAEETPGELVDIVDGYPYESNDQYFLWKCDMNGKKLKEIDLSEATKDMDYFYCQSMVQDGAGELYLNSDQSILHFSAEGEARETLDTGDMYISSMVATGDGTILLSGWDNNTGSSGIFRLENGKPVRLETEADSVYNSMNLYPGDGSTVLMSDSKQLYSMDAATGKVTPLLSWLDSDINGNNVSAVITGGADNILVLLQGYRQTTGSFYELGTLTKTPADQIPARTILTLGAEYLGDNLQEALIRFNRSSDTYRITLVDYSVYDTEEDWEAGAKQMEKDIIAGSGPDILSLESGHVDRYIAKGALADLKPLMEKSGYDQNNLLSGPMKAYHREDKYYGLPLSFGLYTVYASARLAGDRDRWTIQELGQIIDGLEDGTQVMQWATRSDFLMMMLYQGMGNLVDYGKATCSFDSQEFQDLLTVAAKLPAEYPEYQDSDEDLVYHDEMQLLQQGDQLMAYGYATGSYEIRNMYRLYTKENGFIRPGFPSGEGNGAMLGVQSGLAISSRSAHQEGAWAFLETMLSDEVQENQWSLPVTRSAFDKVLAEAMEKPSYLDERTGKTEYVESTGYIGETEYKIGELTEAQAEDFLAYVNGAALMSSYDSTIMEIITEEAEAFFAGDKTVQEVAGLIQNRVSIYLGETS